MEQFYSIGMILVMIAIFYFLLIRPENKRKKQAEEMRNSLKKGDQITTIGGIVGKIVMVGEETIVIETSDDRVRMELTKWSVSTNNSQWIRRLKRRPRLRKLPRRSLPRFPRVPITRSSNLCKSA